jgi:hypothetical protein
VGKFQTTTKSRDPRCHAAQIKKPDRQRKETQQHTTHKVHPTNAQETFHHLLPLLYFVIMGGGHDNNKSVNTCGIAEVTIFILAIASGTACSICSKTMMELHGVGQTGEVELFQKPIFQTFGMFVGMMFGLVMHFVVLIFKIPFPGYVHSSPLSTNNVGLSSGGNHNYGSIEDNEKQGLVRETPANSNENQEVPIWMYFFLAIPSIFDLAATVLCMMGLQYIDVSIYQLLRGSGKKESMSFVRMTFVSKVAAS